MASVKKKMPRATTAATPVMYCFMMVIFRSPGVMWLVYKIVTTYGVQSDTCNMMVIR